MLLFSQYGIIFSVMVARLAIPLTVFLSMLGAAVIITNNRMALNESFGVLVGFGVATFFSMLMGLFISAILRQSAERQQIIDELKAARASLARAERQAGILEERQRLAREIHDTLAQGFTSIVMHLEAADSAMPDDLTLANARQHLDRARATARDSLAEARRFVWALRSEPLERESLAGAIRRVAGRWAEESGTGAQVEISGEERPLPSPYEVTLLRAAQEALANVRRHAAARQVTLTLTYMADQVILDVQDDGQGFDPTQPRPDENRDGARGGFGLIGMRERVEQLGGHLFIESAPGEGATLVVDLPLVPADKPSEVS
jgi:signal transduction histidine kinase